MRQTDDPLGGSFALEALTDELEAGAERELDRIREMGGMLATIDSGYIQREIEASAYRLQRDVEEGERVVVGVNRFPSRSEESAALRIHVLDPGLEAEQIGRLRDVRLRRDSGVVEASLARLAAVAGSTNNLMPAVLEAVRNMASVGEISAVLGGVFGTSHDAG